MKYYTYFNQMIKKRIGVIKIMLKVERLTARAFVTVKS